MTEEEKKRTNNYCDDETKKEIETRFNEWRAVQFWPGKVKGSIAFGLIAIAIVLPRYNVFGAWLASLDVYARTFYYFIVALFGVFYLYGGFSRRMSNKTRLQLFLSFFLLGGGFMFMFGLATTGAGRLLCFLMFVAGIVSFRKIKYVGKEGDVPADSDIDCEKLHQVETQVREEQRISAQEEALQTEDEQGYDWDHWRDQSIYIAPFAERFLVAVTAMVSIGANFILSSKFDFPSFVTITILMIIGFVAVSYVEGIFSLKQDKDFRMNAGIYYFVIFLSGWMICLGDAYREWFVFVLIGIIVFITNLVFSVRYIKLIRWIIREEIK